MEFLDYKALEKREYLMIEVPEIIGTTANRFWWACIRLGITPRKNYQGYVYITRRELCMIHNLLYFESRDVFLQDEEVGIVE